MENFFHPDIKINISSSSKSNIQLNSKIQGLQNVNFQQVLTNVNGDIQSVSIESKPYIESLNIIQNENQKQDLKDDKSNTKIRTLEIEISNQDPSVLYSTFNPQKPVEVEKSLSNKVFIKKENSKNITNKKNQQKKLFVEKDNNLDTTLLKETTENQQNSLTTLKKDDNISLLEQKKYNKEDKDGNNKKKNSIDDFDFNNNEALISDEDIEKIVSNYGLDFTNIFSRGESKNSPKNYEELINSLLFGLSKENLLSDDITKLTTYVTQKNIEISNNEKQAIKALIDELLKHETNFANNNSVIKFSEKAFDFISKIIPNELMKGFLKKISENDKKNKDRFIKSIVRFINAKDTLDDINNIKDFILSDLKNKNNDDLNSISDFLFNKANKNDYPKLYNFLVSENIKQNLIPGFFKFMCLSFIESYENNQWEKTNQTLRIIQKYFSSEVFNENDKKLISSLIMKKLFENTKINSFIIEDYLLKVINGEIIDKSNLLLLEKESSYSLLSYLPYNINKDVKKILLDFESNSSEQEINNKDELYKEDEYQLVFTTQIKINNQKKKYDSILVLFDIKRNKEIFLNSKNNKFMSFLDSGEYRILGFYPIINNINLGFIKIPTKYISKLTFSLEGLFEIFIMGRIELSLNIKSLNIKSLDLKNNSVQMINFLEKENFKTKNKIIKLNSKIL